MLYEVITIPYHERQGRNDLRNYNNIPVPTSYMVCDTKYDFFGGYDFKEDGGFIHVANRHIAPGKKHRITSYNVCYTKLLRQMGWRWMFWAELVPATLFFLLAFLIPESPRYLVKIGNLSKAKSILNRIGRNNFV